MMKPEIMLCLKKLIVLAFFTFGCDSDPSEFVIVQYPEEGIEADTEKDTENPNKGNGDTGEDGSDEDSTKNNNEEKNQASATDEDDNTDIDAGALRHDGRVDGEEVSLTDDDTSQNQMDDSLASDQESDSTSDEGSGVTGPGSCDLVGVWGGRIDAETMWGGRTGGLILQGRGLLEMYFRMRIDSVDPADDSIHGTVRICGATVPAFLSTPLLCEAYQVDFPDSLWERSTLPTLPFTAKRNCDEEGCSVDFDKITCLLGLSLNNATEAPLSEEEKDIEKIECEAGFGRKCFPDQDGDGRPGVMANILTTGFTKQFGYSCPNARFDNRAAPLSTNFMAILNDSWTARADRIDLGGRAVFNVSSNINDDCSSISGIANGVSISLHSPSCMLKQGSRDIQSSPPAGPNQECDENQNIFINQTLPNYVFLPEGETPSDELEQLDISPSKGTHLSMVKLGSLNDLVSCVDIREIEY